MRADLLDFIGTDGHGSKYRKPLMGACAAYVEKKEGSTYARRIFWKIPGNYWKINDRREEWNRIYEVQRKLNWI